MSTASGTLPRPVDALSPLSPRLSLGPVQNPVRVALHGQAALASLALAAYFAGIPTPHPTARTLLVVFATSQCALYTVSTLYHGIPWRPRWKRRMQRVDHSMIYVKIAGTLSPLAWVAVDGPLCGVLLGTAWGIAAAGIAQKLLLPDLYEKASVPIQVLQASLGIPVMAQLSGRFPIEALALAAGGALLYTVGLVAFLTERPRLWPRVFSHHEVFHVCVVAGSYAHFTLAIRYLARVA